MTEKFIIQVIDNEIAGFGNISKSTVDGVEQEIINLEVSEELYNAVLEDRQSFDPESGVDFVPKYIYSKGEIILDPDYTEKQAQKERERINQLSLTKREVFLALYKDKGITPEQIKAQITDPEALIEFEYANDYFRGNPLINVIGKALGYTEGQLDYLFQYKELL